MSDPIDKPVELGRMEIEGEVLREVSLHPDMVQDAGKCPGCGGVDLLWEGVFRRAFLEEFSGGISLGEQLQSLEKTIVAINCRDCHTRFLLSPRSLYELHKIIVDLQMEVATYRGLTVVDEKKGKVN